MQIIAKIMASIASALLWIFILYISHNCHFLGFFFIQTATWSAAYSPWLLFFFSPSLFTHTFPRGSRGFFFSDLF